MRLRPSRAERNALAWSWYCERLLSSLGSVADTMNTMHQEIFSKPHPRGSTGASPLAETGGTPRLSAVQLDPAACVHQQACGSYPGSTRAESPPTAAESPAHRSHHAPPVHDPAHRFCQLQDRGRPAITSTVCPVWGSGNFTSRVQLKSAGNKRLLRRKGVFARLVVALMDGLQAFAARLVLRLLRRRGGWWL